MELNKTNCSIIISSFDGFSDVWEPFFKLFFRYWPNCPFPIYLITNYKQYQNPKVVSLKLGEDCGWADNLKKALDRINTKYVLYLQEDYLLNKPVDNNRIKQLLHLIDKYKASHLRLWPTKITANRYFSPELVELLPGAKYRLSTQAAFWNKDDLREFLRPGESGWKFELENDNAKRKDKLFLSVRRNEPAIHYFATAIKKGIWFYDAVKLCEREGVIINKTARPIESFGHYLKRKIIAIPFLGRVFDFIIRHLK